MASTAFDDGDAQSADAVEREGSRPDFAIIAYAPLASLDTGWRPPCIMPPDMDAKALSVLGPADHVSRKTQPTFLYHTTDDELVPVTHATAYFNALVAKKVPAELHIFRHGRHGLGMAMTEPELAVWPSLLASWLRGQGLIGFNRAPPAP